TETHCQLILKVAETRQGLQHISACLLAELHDLRFLLKQVPAQLLNDMLPVQQVGNREHAQRTEAKEQGPSSVPGGGCVTAKHRRIHKQGQTPSEDDNHPERKHRQLPVAAIERFRVDLVKKI